MDLEKAMVMPKDHFAVTDEGKVIYTAVQEGIKKSIEWSHKLVTEDLIDPKRSRRNGLPMLQKPSIRSLLLLGYCKSLITMLIM